MVVYGCLLTITMDGKKLNWLLTVHNLENKPNTCLVVHMRDKSTVKILSINPFTYERYTSMSDEVLASFDSYIPVIYNHV